MKVNGVWYLENIPNYVLLETDTGNLAKFRISPFIDINPEELIKSESIYNGYYLNIYKGKPLPESLYSFY